MEAFRIPNSYLSSDNLGDGLDRHPKGSVEEPEGDCQSLAMPTENFRFQCLDFVSLTIIRTDPHLAVESSQNGGDLGNMRVLVIPSKESVNFSLDLNPTTPGIYTQTFLPLQFSQSCDFILTTTVSI